MSAAIASSPDPSAVKAAVDVLRADPGFRVLRRLEVPTGPTGAVTSSSRTRCAAVIDVEATGLDVAAAEIVELAVRRVRFGLDGVIVEIGRPRTWLQQPSEPLTPDVSRLTGLTDADLAGHRIDGGEVADVLAGVDCCIAHNAGYDRKLVERTFPAVAGMAWACSMREVDWRARGYDGRSLGHLLLQRGYFSAAHRAGADVDALISLLRCTRGSDRSALGELLVTAGTPGWIVSARGAHYDSRHLLRARGYRWNADADVKAWEREITDAGRTEEEFWLAANIYAADAGSRALGPDWREIDWWSRHGRMERDDDRRAPRRP